MTTRKPKRRPIANSPSKIRTNLSPTIQRGDEERIRVLGLLEDDRAERPVPTIRTKPITITDGTGKTTSREPTAERASWRDPEDTSPNRRTARMIDGYRAADALTTLKKRGGPITPLHMQAAIALRNAYEIGELGARPGYERPEISSPQFGPMDGPQTMRLDALKSYRDAKQSVPRSQWPILEHVVIKNASVSSYGTKNHRRRDQAVGYLIAALDCLVDHYDLKNKSKKARKST